jgi:radical SAM protein with 4Fe4S-binding SPASM domain
VSASYLLERDWRARGLDLNLGRLGAGGMELPEEDLRRVRRLAAGKPRCESCFCRWQCAGGCHVNHSFPGCPPAYDDFCIQTRLIAACAALDGLGLGPLADELMADRAEMQRLAGRPSDRLEDCRGPA